MMKINIENATDIELISLLRMLTITKFSIDDAEGFIGHPVVEELVSETRQKLVKRIGKQAYIKKFQYKELTDFQLNLLASSLARSVVIRITDEVNLKQKILLLSSPIIPTDSLIRNVISRARKI